MHSRYWAVAALSVAAAALPRGAGAQLSSVVGNKQTTPIDNKQPVAFTADDFNYDRTSGIVTATGHVEAWQNDHVLRADKVTFDRNTNVAAASGNVVLVEPDGQVLFSDYAELTQGMREAVLKGMRTVLAQNGKLVANGARRTDGQVNEMTRAVYTACDLCKTDPAKPPLWQLRAFTATQDTENHRIEYTDATLDMFGIPVGYLPYFSHPDPSVKRASGFLVPSIGESSHIGAFVATPYYWSIDPQQDVTITPKITTQSGAELTADYRRRFNDGMIEAFGGGAIDRGNPEGFLFSRATFTWDDTFRYGFNINYASSATYLTDFQVPNYNSVLTSNAFIEGFGVGSYTKLDTIGYEGLATSINQTKIPYVLPRYEYRYFSEPDALGGRIRFDTTDFDVYRGEGTGTRRAAASLDWQRPFSGSLGEQYKVTVHLDAAFYNADQINQQPTYGNISAENTEHAQPTVAAEMRWPFMRDGGSTGTQIVEPIVQLVAAPNAPSFLGGKIPNEDGLDFEFSDANLFSINRFGGYDRFEGGLRVNAAIHTNWIVGGTNIDTLVGESFKNHTDNSVPPLSGLNSRLSDVVARATITPATWFDLTGRTRVDPHNGDIRFVDAIASAGVPLLRASAGYLYSATNPYFLYDQSPQSVQPTGYPSSYFTPRNEVTAGLSTQFGPWKLSGYARRDVKLSKMTSVGTHGTYEDECFIFDVNFYQRYTSINNDKGGTTILFTVTLKTIGAFGVHGS